MLAHGTLVEPRQNSPIGLLSVCDVFFIVIGTYVFNGKSGRLISQTALIAGDELKVAWFSREIILPYQQLGALGLSAVVAGNRFEFVCGGSVVGNGIHRRILWWKWLLVKDRESQERTCDAYYRDGCSDQFDCGYDSAPRISTQFRVVGNFVDANDNISQKHHHKM